MITFEKTPEVVVSDMTEEFIFTMEANNIRCIKVQPTFVIEHLEKQFDEYMNWNNYGNWNGHPKEINTAWDIDHIIPLATAITEEDVESVIAEVAIEKSRKIEAIKSAQWLENHNEEVSKKLMKNI